MRHTDRRRAIITVLTAAALAVGGALVAAPAAQATPSSSDTLGVDVSGAVNWGNAPAGTQFAYIEAVTGSGTGSATKVTANSAFYPNWAGATQAGLARGAYALGVPSPSAPSAVSQATYFYDNGGALSTASPYSLPPVIDLEFDSNGSCRTTDVGFIQNWISSYVTTFTKLSGVRPVIYTSSAYWNDCVGTGNSMLKSYPLWVTAPSSTATAPTVNFGGWTNWDFWQYSVTNATGGFDQDAFNGSLSALRALGTPRISGSDRYATSLAAALSFQPGVSEAFVADGQNYPDALAAGAAAGKAFGPVLLVPPSGSLPANVRQALSYLKPQKIVVVGGPSAVSSTVATALASYGTVSRQDGPDRLATSAAIAKNFSAGVANAYVAMGNDWPDALSGSALAASAQGSGPMLLVSTTSVPASVASELAALKPQHIYVLGGTTVVSSAVQSALAKYTASRSSSAVSRISGADRYATSVAIAQHLDSINGSATGPLYAASGANFPDALVGAPVAALTSQPLLLVPPASSLPSEVRTEASRLAATSLAILGGKTAVSASVQAALNGLTG